MKLYLILIIYILFKLTCAYLNDFLYQAIGFWELGESLEDYSYSNNSAT